MLETQTMVSEQTTSGEERPLEALRIGAADIAEGFRNWRIWHLLGTSELRRRYARSSLGQFWLTLSTGITVLALGLVWTQLWKATISDLMPYFAISYVLWLFVTAFFTEATTVFAANGNYFLNQRMTFSTVILALAYRSLITLAHNSAIVIAVLLFFAVPVTPSALLGLGGLVLMTISGVSISYMIAIACLRYRDLVQVVSNIIQIVFFVTPVLWKPNVLPEDVRWLVDYNPFALFLSIVRDPILGVPVPETRWMAALAITAASVLLSLFTVGKLRKRIIYWM